MHSKNWTAILSACGLSVLLLSFFVTLKVLDYRESVRSKLIWSSSDFSEASWSRVLGGLTQPNASAAPDGNDIATKLMENPNAGRHRLEGLVPLPGSGPYVFSLFVKPAERQAILVEVLDAGNKGRYGMAKFDLATGTITATGGDLIDARIQNLKGGWFRVWVTLPYASQTGAVGISLINDKQEIDYVGVSNFGLYIWAAQIAGNF